MIDERIRAVLAFYGDAHNYRDQHGRGALAYGCREHGFDTVPVDVDYGEKARELLRELSGGDR